VLASAARGSDIFSRGEDLRSSSRNRRPTEQRWGCAESIFQYMIRTSEKYFSGKDFLGKPGGGCLQGRNRAFGGFSSLFVRYVFGSFLADQRTNSEEKANQTHLRPCPDASGKPAGNGVFRPKRPLFFRSSDHILNSR
jgi:hypothetical protein